MSRFRLIILLNISVISVVTLLTGCGEKPSIKIAEPHKPPPYVIPEKKAEEIYRYGGDVYRDPFIALNEKRLISPVLQASGEAEKPNIGIFDLRGIITDKNCRIALFSSPMGTYILKNGRLYDNRNRAVRGISGTVDSKSSTLITDDKFLKTFKLTETH